MQPRVFLQLGRVSNLPTVWSNVLCGMVLSGTPLGLARTLVLLASGSFLYVGGMLLNDAFDAEFDRKHRPERPIPAGRVTRREVFALGFELLLAAVALLGLYAIAERTPAGAWLPFVGLLTALTIVSYDRFHKGFAWAPLVMGLCRGELYVLAALSGAASLSENVLLSAAALVLFVVGLTHIARFETASRIGRVWPAAFVLVPSALAVQRVSQASLPAGELVLFTLLWLACTAWALRSVALALRGGRNIPRAVVSLIAGISLVDAVLIASHGNAIAALAAVLAFAATLGLQRFVSGT